MVNNKPVFLKKGTQPSNRTIKIHSYCLVISFGLLSIVAIYAQYQPVHYFSQDQYYFEPFELPGGKLNNVIQCMAQDSSGVLWIGTQNGLVKYDGRQFERFLHNPLDSNSLSSNYIESIHIDANNALWIGIYAGGLNKFNPITNQFQRYFLKDEAGKELRTMGVNIIQSFQQYIWLGTNNGLHRFNPESGLFKNYYFNRESVDILTANVVRTIYVDKSETLWMGIGFTWDPDTTKGGLYKYRREQDDFMEYRHNPLDKNSLSDNRVKGIFEDSNNNFWISTMGDGINKMDRKNNQFISFPYQPNHPERLSRPLVEAIKYRDNFYNQVQFIHEDQDNRLWIGSFDNGLNVYDPITEKQIHFERGINGLETNNIWNIFESKDNTIFICTGAEGQGKNYKLKIKRNLFSFYALSDNSEIVQLIADKNKDIWLSNSTSTKTWRFEPQKKTLDLVNSELKKKTFSIELVAKKNPLSQLPTTLFQKIIFGETGLQKIFDEFQHDLKPGLKVRDLFLQCLKKDKAGNIWIGTWGHGLFYINQQTRTIKSYKHIATESSSIGGNHISVIFEDKEGVIWVGGGKEAKNLNFPFFLDHLESTADTFTHFYAKGTDYGYPATIAEDKAGNLWYPTILDGIHQLDKTTGKINKYNQSNSLMPSDEIRGLVIDQLDNIWMSSENTLIRFTPNRESFVEYNQEDGLKVNKFGYGAVNITADNTIYFGGDGGFHFFKPEQVLAAENQAIPKIIISELSIHNQANSEKEIETVKIINPTDTAIELTHLENSFDLGFTCIDYQNTDKVYLAYKLENQDRNWRKADDKKTAQYYNLQPGTYLFQVRGTNSKGIWNKKGSQLSITILPPWWLTWWAKLIYTIIGLLGVYALIQWQTKVQRKKLERVNRLNQRLQQIDKLKDQFLANTSHELRTPLQGIIGLSESLAERVQESDQKEDLSMIISSGKRLNNLVNDILDFSKLKNFDIQLIQKSISLHALVDIILKNNAPLVKGKNLKLISAVPRELPPVFADENRLQQVLYNLIGNAIKFTETGNITIAAIEKEKQLQVSVTDTGIGIPENKQSAIFQEFEQGDGSTTRAYAGTGLGLSISKRLIELHGGKMWVESTSEKGSTFFFTLPIATESATTLTIAPKATTLNSPISPINTERELTPIAVGAIRILIVDDEPINQQVLKNHLAGKGFHLTQAMNGKEAIKAIENRDSFDLVLLDVMMPSMSGYEVCQQIREKFLPSELPVIMITAKDQLQDIVQGLTLGANDYLPKPFHKEELLARINTQLDLHRIFNVAGRFVPNEFLHSLNRNRITEVLLGDHIQKEVTVLFLDIRGYTTLSETMTPEDNFRFVNAFHGRMGPIIQKHKGFVNQYLGDAIMAIFPASPETALHAAIDMQEALRSYNQERSAVGRQKIKMGVGLHTGSLIMGIIGDKNRLDAATIADTVNTASRIEGLTKYYGASILLTEDSLEKMENKAAFHLRYLGQVLVKGKKNPIGIYECFEGDAPALFAHKLKMTVEFRLGLEQYFARDFPEASGSFSKVLKSNSEDKVAELFLNKAARYIHEDVPNGWVGVEEMRFK